MKFALGFRVGGLKAAEHLLNVRRLEAACFGHVSGVPLLHLR